jgi:endo-1,4-beta-xylanase
MKLTVYLMLILMMSVGCKRDVQKIIDCQEISLHSQATFNVGVAVDADKLFKDQKYKKKLLTHFNSITPENSFKIQYLMPSHNFFNWKQADDLVAFAMENHLQFHGHTLVWGEHLPEWLVNYNGDWGSFYKRYIRAVVGRYKGKVKAWDVVNEAFEDDGTLKDNIWRQKIGDNYIELAFQYAREADPQALLFLNEVNCESKSRKLSAVTYMAMQINKERPYIDGIGLQMHITYNFPSDRQLENAMRFISGAGFKVHISEMDIKINDNEELTQPSYQTLREQKKRIEFIVKTYNELPSENQYAVSLWGLSDKDSWLQKQGNKYEWPLLFDDDLNIKPAFCGFINGLQ